MSDPVESVIDDLLAALDPPGSVHPEFARQVSEQLRRLRPRPATSVDGEALYRPYLRGSPIDGVAISTIGGSFRGETIAASDPTAARLDEIQLDLGEGPCWEAMAVAGPVSVVDTGSETRWPQFARAADGIEIRAVFAFPLVFAGLRIGVVDAYSRTPGPLPDGLARELASTSAATSMRVLSAVLRDDPEEQSTRPGSRRTVHHATGMISARYRTSPEEARLVLRARAFARNRSVVDVAEDIVTRREALTGGPLTAEDAG